MRYVYDGNNVLQETDDTGVVAADYTYQPGEYGLTISQRRDGDSAFHLFDGMSSHNEAGCVRSRGIAGCAVCLPFSMRSESSRPFFRENVGASVVESWR